MGLRFSKTFRVGKFLRLNLSKSGPSIGLGPSGANVNLSRRGSRTTLGIPGTGVSYTSQGRWGRRRAEDGERPPRASSFSAGLLFIIGVSIVLIAIALLSR